MATVGSALRIFMGIGFKDKLLERLENRQFSEVRSDKSTIKRRMGNQPCISHAVTLLNAKNPTSIEQTVRPGEWSENAKKRMIFEIVMVVTPKLSAAEKNRSARLENTHNTLLPECHKVFATLSLTPEETAKILQASKGQGESKSWKRLRIGKFKGVRVALNNFWHLLLSCVLLLCVVCVLESC